MTSPDHWHKKWFPESIRLQAPENILSTNNRDGTFSVMCRYSDLTELRAHNDKSPLPQPMKLYLLMDGHIGQYPLPIIDFTAMTPYGAFEINVLSSKLEGDMAYDRNCAECTWSVFPCKEHIKSNNRQV